MWLSEGPQFRTNSSLLGSAHWWYQITAAIWCQDLSQHRRQECLFCSQYSLNGGVTINAGPGCEAKYLTTQDIHFPSPQMASIQTNKQTKSSGTLQFRRKFGAVLWLAPHENQNLHTISGYVCLFIMQAKKCGTDSTCFLSLHQHCGLWNFIVRILYSEIKRLYEIKPMKPNSNYKQNIFYI